jgi:hypothetical protein
MIANRTGHRGTDVNVRSFLHIAPGCQSGIRQIEPPDERPVFGLATAERAVAKPPTAVLRPEHRDLSADQFAQPNDGGSRHGTKPKR